MSQPRQAGGGFQSRGGRSPVTRGPASNKLYPALGSKETKIPIPVTANTIERHKGGIAPKWSWASTVCSAILMWCVPPCCGFIGLLFSILAYVDHKTGNYSAARFKRRCGWCWVGAGIVLVLLSITATVLIVVFREAIAAWCDKRPYCIIIPVY